MASLIGRLLVATPELFDPNFQRTVIFVIEHSDEEGAMGVVLNRATEIDAADHLPEWAAVTVAPHVVFAGGPVSPEIAFCLIDSPGAPRSGWAPLLDDVGVADLGGDPGDHGGVQRARIFSGYAGWASGQLEMELAETAWFVLDGDADDVFTENPASLWRSVLARQPGVLSWYADYPADPRLN